MQAPDRETTATVGPVADTATPQPAGSPAGDRERALGSRVAGGLLRGFTLIGFAVMFAVFAFLSPDVFPTADNIKSILDLSSPIVIVAVGLTVVLVVGEFDLSFTGLISLVAVVSVKLMEGGASTTVAVIAGIAVGIAGGMVAGLLVAAERASSFIVTLALGAVWGGVALGISGGGGSTVAVATETYMDLAQRQLAGVQITIVYALVVAVLGAALLRYTVFGREATAIGNNPRAALLAGIGLVTTRVGAFAVMGLCSALAAIILSARTGQFSPDMAGGMLIPPFVAAFFGTSVLMAGRFNVFGSVVGALFIATLQTGLIVQGLLDWVSSLIVGCALIIILFIASQSRSSR